MKLKSMVLSAALALTVAGPAMASETGIVYKQAAENDSSYCHIKYMAFTAESLRNGTLEFDSSDIIDRYGACNFDPKSQQELQSQMAASHRGLHGDGGNDSAGADSD